MQLLSSRKKMFKLELTRCLSVGLGYTDTSSSFDIFNKLPDSDL